MKIRFVGGPCDGAESLLYDPLPVHIDAAGPHEDRMSELLGTAPARVEPAKARYHLVHRDARGAVYVVARAGSGADDVSANARVFDGPL